MNRVIPSSHMTAPMFFVIYSNEVHEVHILYIFKNFRKLSPIKFQESRGGMYRIIWLREIYYAIGLYAMYSVFNKYS